MEIKILGEVESYDNLLSSIPQIINRIETICKNSDLVYSHMVIEGREVYDDPETYLQENIADLNRVEIVLKTIQEMMGEMMESAVDYLDRANAEINNLAEEFLQRANGGDLAPFSTVVGRDVLAPGDYKPVGKDLPGTQWPEYGFPREAG